MNYLIDTHVLIWFGETHPQLPPKIRTLIEAPGNQIIVSHATIWEMSIKMALGKLQVTYTLAEWERLLTENNFTLINSTFHQYEILRTLPFHHQDPFDRLMIAQAIAENLTIITHDPKFKSYDVSLEFF